MFTNCPACGMQYRADEDGSHGERQTAICQVCGCDLGFGSQVPDGESSEKDGVTEFACPKCGRNQVQGEECIQCGVIFEKILSTNQGGTDSAKTESWRKELIPWSVIALIVLCILLVVVTHFSTFQPDKKPENATAKTQAPDQVQPQALPQAKSSISFEIIKASRSGNGKCGFDIRLSQKIPEDVLRQIALNIREKESDCYGRIFINYYLPGMSPEFSDAWATTHFNPDLKVKILGLTDNQERALTSTVSKADVGIWVDDLMGHTIIIRRTPSGMLIQHTYKDGSGSTAGLQESKLGKKTVLIEDGNEYGEYFLIDRSGNLGVYDKQGLITVMRAIR